MKCDKIAREILSTAREMRKYKMSSDAKLLLARIELLAEDLLKGGRS